MDPLSTAGPGEALRSEAPPPLGPGIYVHLPFCKNLCSYCDFYVAVRGDAARGRFLESLDLELRLAAEADDLEGSPVQTVFLGGGTPSLLTGEQIGRVLSRIGELFPIARGAEITVECNPDSLTREKIDACLDAGVTRMSLGVQSMDPEILALLERPHGPGDVVAAVRGLRAAGASSICVDLIYGIPGGDAAWGNTLDAVLALGPDHISAYLLTLEPKAKLARRLAREGRALPPDEVAAAEYELLRERVLGAGFGQYEISNFARVGHESRHNRNYWARGEYLGLGPAAHSHARGRRWANVRSLSRYEQALADGRLPRDEEETIGRTERAEELLFLGLRRAEGVSLAELRGGLNEGEIRAIVARADALRSTGWLDPDRDRLKLPPSKYLLENQVIVELMLALDQPEVTA